MMPSIESFLGHQHNVATYHVLVYVLLACNFFPIAFNHWVMILYGHEPPHNCKMPEGWAWHRNDSIPIVFNNGQGQFHKCHMYKDPENRSLGNKRCVYGWQYHVTSPEWPIIAEWNLVCDRSHLVHVVTVLYFVGCLMGALIFGTLADRFGRRGIMFICLFGQTLVGIVLFFIQRFILFATLRFFQGIFIQGLEISTFVMVMEFVQPKFRTMAGSGCFIFYSCGMMFLAFLGYTIQHWRYIQLAFSIPSLIGVFYLCIIPESLRWLIVNLRTSDVTRTLKKYSRITSTPLKKNLGDSVECIIKAFELDARLFYDVRDLFRSTTLRRFSLFHCFCWLSASLVYSSLSHFVSVLNGNIYLNFLLIGFIELLSHFAALAALQRFGRRKPLFLFFIVGGILSICSVLVEHLAKNQSENAEKVSIVLAVFGKICISACISGLYIFSTEIFPTVLRSIGVGLCSVWKITGILLVPVINLLGSHTLKAIPIILVGAVSMVAAFVVLMLPETLAKSLSDTTEEAEDLGQHKIMTPIIDKSSNQSGKINLITETPKTPPLKRSSSVTNEKADFSKLHADQTVVNDAMNVTDIISYNDEVNKSPENNRNNRVVRFLGIDVLDDMACQRERKRSVKSNDPILVQERRVRFSNVVHDIDGLMAAIHASTKNIQASDVEENTTDDSVKELAGNETEESFNQQLSLEFIQATYDTESASAVPSLETNNDIVRPVVGILKKSSQDETSKKIVKSPHPVRKLSPTQEGFPRIDENINSDTNEKLEIVTRGGCLSENKESTSETNESKSLEDDHLTKEIEISNDDLWVESYCLPPPDDGTRTPSSSSGEPTPEGSRRAIQSDDVAENVKEELYSEYSEALLMNDEKCSKESSFHSNTQNNSLPIFVDCNSNEVIERKRKISVYTMPTDYPCYS